MTSHGRRASARTILNARASQKAARRHTKTREFLVAAAASVLLALALTQSATAGAVPLPRGAGPGGTFLHATPARPTGPSVEGQSAGSLAPLVTGGNGESLKYWGGEVQHKPELDLLFWGDNFWNGTQPFYEGVSLYTEYKGFYDDLSNELEAPGEASWQGILSQYFGKSGTYGDAHVVGETDEAAINAPQNITVENIKKEITTWANRGLAQNPNTQVIVLAAPGTSYAEDPEKGCGYHGIDEQGYSYAFVAYAGDLDHYFNKNKENYSCNYRAAGKEVETTQLMWSSTAIASHEFAEEATDPGLNGEYAWFSTEGQEIGDLCDYEPLNSVELPEKNGRPGWWYVTELWDDGGGNTCKLEDPPYPPVPPPTVTTEPATSLAAYQATLNATVNTNGPEASYHFELGTTEAYGRNIPYPEGKLAYGSSTVPVSTLAESLTPNTTYHYRVVATNSSGTSRGTDRTFTTPFPPPEVRTTRALEVGPTIATLQGEVTTSREVPTTTYFEYGTTMSYGSVTAEQHESFGGTKGISAAVTGLAPSTTYHYRIVSYNNGGTSRGADETFTTTPSPQAITEGPSGVTTGQGTLHASINPGGSSTTYQFEYWPSNKPTEVKNVPEPAGSAGSGTSKVKVSQQVTGLTTHASYKYRVRATNSHGTSYGATETLIASPALVVQPTPNPEGASGVRLLQVSCTSASACVASLATNSADSVAVERWSGTKWTIETLPVVSGSTRGGLTGPISCWSGGFCTAIGWYEAAG